MDKSALRTAILAQLETDLNLQLQAALNSRDEATHEESQAENKYDMHAQEAAYLAEGQARLVNEIRESINLYVSLPLPEFTDSEVISVGAVVVMNDPKGTSTHVFIGPRAGGMELIVDSQSYLVITPSSPLGRQLLGKRVGDKVTLPGRGSSVVHRITAVR